MDEFEVREMLKETDIPFLAAGYNEWIGADRKLLSFDEMGKDYLENCYNYLVKQEDNITRGFSGNNRKRKFSEAEQREILKITNKLYKRKLNELKIYLNKK